MTDQFFGRLGEFARDDVGGPAVEYSLVASLIAMTILVGFLLMTDRVQTTYEIIATSM